MLSKGRIELIIGPMFAGKSTELLRRIKLHKITGKKCLLIKYEGDERYSADSVSTHDQEHVPATSLRILNELSEEDIENAEVIGIDEGEFFEDIKPFCENMANQKKIVIVSALDGTFLRTGFEDILQLIPLAEKVKKLEAICKVCREDASFSHRMVAGDELELIGGLESYQPLCRECYNDATGQ